MIHDAKHTPERPNNTTDTAKHTRPQIQNVGQIQDLHPMHEAFLWAPPKISELEEGPVSRRSLQDPYQALIEIPRGPCSSTPNSTPPVSEGCSALNWSPALFAIGFIGFSV